MLPFLRFNTASGKYCCNDGLHALYGRVFRSFNTASGKYCCNALSQPRSCCKSNAVSIPQAVSTVATHLHLHNLRCLKAWCFNTASGKYCCNKESRSLKGVVDPTLRFNTASGKYCCNLPFKAFGKTAELSFNTASGKYCCNPYFVDTYHQSRLMFQYRKR